jgi:3-mercaptopyruvate sulfurtransferase SseA
MKHPCVILIGLCFTVTAFAQLPFKYDSLYKTIYAQDICAFFQKHPDMVLLDVRTPGEFYDTSRFARLNQGHLKGAINLDIEAIKKDSSLVDQYKNKTIVLYCSHSQRSRRVSKLLAEKGFHDFYNLNGGMSSFNQLAEADFPCKKEWIVSTVPYKNLSFTETADFLRNEKEVLIIDVRPAIQFNSVDTTLSSNVGRIKGAINIPYNEFDQKINEWIKSKYKPVLIYGESGDGNPARAAAEMNRKGFTRVYHLLGGINDFIASQETTPFIENPTPYCILNTIRSLELLKKTPNLIVYDTRANVEYANQLTGMLAYRNLGHIKGAIHVEELAISTIQLPGNKNASILLVGDEAAFKFAKQLTDKGFKKVYILNSFYDFVWSGFNVKSCSETRNFLVDHPGLY